MWGNHHLKRPPSVIKPLLIFKFEENSATSFAISLHRKLQDNAGGISLLAALSNVTFMAEEKRQKKDKECYKNRGLSLSPLKGVTG